MPGTPSLVFPRKGALSGVDDLSTLQRIVLDAMERLVTSGALRADRATGAMYVLTALTQCSEQACEALPWLYQPPDV